MALTWSNSCQNYILSKQNACSTAASKSVVFCEVKKEISYARCCLECLAKWPIDKRCTHIEYIDFILFFQSRP